MSILLALLEPRRLWTAIRLEVVESNSLIDIIYASN